MTQCRNLRLEWVEHQGRSCLRVTGWTECELGELEGLGADEMGRRLALLPSEVLTTGGDLRAVPPVSGHFTAEQDAVFFVPRFPFMAGTGYSFVIGLDRQEERPEVWAILRPAAPRAPATEVVAIYPTAAELPVNLLRIYVHFSGPMSEGWANQAIRVCREDTGAILEAVFLPPDPELWDSDRQRLTMLLDPGRIKRGLVPNTELGYPLIEGVPIRIFVDREFRDAAGQPLKADAGRNYHIGPALRSRIDPNRWQLSVPEPASSHPLVVDFGRPLDHALLQRCLRIRDSDGNPLPGKGDSGVGQISWRYTPLSPWAADRYQLDINPSLEDVAGNSPGRVFDRDISEPGDLPSGAGRFVVDFSCVPATTPIE